MPSFEHVRAVSVDGLDADDEHGCDLFRCVSLRDQFQYLEFAGREELEVVSALIGPFDEVAYQCGDGGGVEEGVAAHGCTAGPDDVVVGAGFQDVAGGAGFERLEQELLVLVHREDEGSEFGSPSREFMRCL
jgi:hypothetical protein